MIVIMARDKQRHLACIENEVSVVKAKFEDTDAHREVLAVIVALPAVSQPHTYVVMARGFNDRCVPILDWPATLKIEAI